MTNEMKILLAQTVTRLFGDLATTQVIAAAEAGQWPDELWHALTENGLTQPLIPAAQGGVGATWSDIYTIIRAVGYYQAPIPLAETITAGWLLSESRLKVPDGPLGLAGNFTGTLFQDDQDNWRLDGSLARVAWGNHVKQCVVSADFAGQQMIVTIPLAGSSIETGHNVAGEPRDKITLSRQVVQAALAPDRLGKNASALYGAMIRAAQIAGAAERALEEAIAYANVRVQFGSPLSKFQAIQQNLAQMACETAAVGTAAEMAFYAASKGPAEASIAAAKIRAGEAGGLVASTAHQVLGAIGFTREHSLNFASRRIWSWRTEFGSASYWAEKLGRLTIERGSDNLWADLTAR
ncbi:MAG: acyl-CoA dehydrogenase [Rhodospirillaceae bacterium]|jgi:acyl-CoA dehydrogenase|nr:acyl-CoA dehydrogenase [Rhodospirillaceae bacterium]MBT7266454.1 acyl-CoA dehydrogenase [Rhodospirillaceae bacterium]